ncbi:hypothetical protein AWB70_07601 [Caballeronia cordobensis]|uniref:Uncharacterized protein n=1 Tax=Caballeronia cordobensis TaxID=1353886 RepID=A0A158JXK1_CABCO|nr:hypothetical protein AWB70_07601 [Caballeronia cordobensis]
MSATCHEGADLVVHELQRCVIADEVMQDLQAKPSSGAGFVSDDETQQGRLREVEALGARIEMTGELVDGGFVVIRHELDFGH